MSNLPLFVMTGSPLGVKVMTPQEKLKEIGTHGWINEEVRWLIARVEQLEEVLNEIASWSEGQTVNSGFDCPSFSQAAREALTAGPKPL